MGDLHRITVLDIKQEKSEEQAMPAYRSVQKKKKNTPGSDDRAYYKILAAFGAAAVAEIFFVTVYRRLYASGGESDISGAMYVLAGILFAACIACISVSIAKRKSRKRMSAQFLGLSVTVLLLSAASLLLARHGMTAAKLLCILCPVVLLLYIVLIIYQREFFVTALLCAVCLFAVWAVKSYRGGGYALASLIIMLLLSALAAAAVFAQGRLGHAGKTKLFVYESPQSRLLLLVTCVLTALATVCTYVWPQAISEIAVIIVSAYLFVSAVYYTIKLM